MRVAKPSWMLSLSLVVLTGMVACNKRVVSKAPVATQTSEWEWEAAEQLFLAGDYEAAARAYESLASNAHSERANLAIFRLAMIYSQPESPVHSLDKAQILLVKLAETRSYSATARLVLALREQIAQLHKDNQERQRKIEQLSSQLEKMKEVDLQKK